MEADREVDVVKERDTLALIDGLARLAREGGASRIEVETEEFAVTVSVDAAPRVSRSAPPARSLVTPIARRTGERCRAPLAVSVRDWPCMLAQISRCPLARAN